MTWNGIALDPRAAVPLGVQLDWSIRAAIADGRLRPGDRLPALRDLAADLGVNHNTLRAAVAKLEGEGLLESRHGTGTFVAETAAAVQEHGALVQRVVQWASDAGLSPRDLAAALYVADPRSATAARDPEAEERRALRDEIAVLDRLVSRLEERLPADPPPELPRRRVRSHILSAEELRAQRDDLVRRLAAAQQALEPGEQAERAAQPEPAAAKQRTPRRAPRPGVSPA